LVVGIGYFGVMPTTISIAQRLLPHRTSLASALLMGGAWCLAAIGPPMAQWLMNHLGMTSAGLVIASMLLLSGLVTLAMPKHSAT
jgi:MFS family permease